MLKSVQLNKDSFTRFVKNMKKNLLKEKNIELKSTEIQEIASKSFGFSNYHAALEADFKKPSQKYHNFIIKLKLSNVISSGNNYNEEYTVLMKGFPFISSYILELNKIVTLKNVLTYRKLLTHFQSYIKKHFPDFLNEFKVEMENGSQIIFSYGSILRLFLSPCNAEKIQPHLTKDAIIEFDHLIQSEIVRNDGLVLNDYGTRLTSIEIVEGTEDEINFMENNGFCDHVLHYEEKSQCSTTREIENKKVDNMEKIEKYLINATVVELDDLKIVLDYSFGESSYEVLLYKADKKIDNVSSVLETYYNALTLVKKLKEILKERNLSHVGYENKIFPDHV